MKKLGFICGEYLSEKAEKNSKIWVIDGDLADSDGAEEFMLKHPERYIAAGIAEQNMVSMVAGMAASGLSPWAFSFASFLCYRAYDQIRVCISQTGLPVVLVGSHAGGCSGRNGKTHTALNDIAIMASLPKINIWTPADGNDTKLAIDIIIANNQPAYLRLPRDPQNIVIQSDEVVRWIGKPSKVALISYGASTNWAVEAQKVLLQQNIEIGVLHFCKVWPLSSEKITELLKDVAVTFVVEDHYAIGGLASFLAHSKFDIEIYNLCWPSDWCGQSGQSEVLLDHFHLSGHRIAEKVMEYLSQD